MSSKEDLTVTDAGITTAYEDVRAQALMDAVEAINLSVNASTEGPARTLAELQAGRAIKGLALGYVRDRYRESGVQLTDLYGIWGEGFLLMLNSGMIFGTDQSGQIDLYTALPDTEWLRNRREILSEVVQIRPSEG
ncbi:hypothetical protein HY024_03790 [Candidatus Curtissbacteria bacterium]|nr:hypothetical protein [Candidatus Curtissbacteria bacterium]